MKRLIRKKRDEENKEHEKQSKPNDQNQQTQEENKQDEMSIESGIPDLDHEAKDADKAEDEIEIEDSSRPDLKKGVKGILLILIINPIQKNLMKLLKPRNSKMPKN